MEENRQERIDRILDLYFSRIAPKGISAELEASVRQWFGEDAYVQEKYTALGQAFEKYVGYDAEPSAEAIASWIETMRKLGLPVSDEVLRSVTPRPRRMSLRRIALRAAAVLLPILLVAGVYLWQSPGSPEMVAETVPAGMSLRQVELPDGTVVWLKSGSRLEYAAGFGRQRKVEVTGEAFFDVAHDSRHPFIVEANDVTVRVTGTEFNVCAWLGAENVEVTLHEGSVRVKTDDSRWTEMEPGEQFGYDCGTKQAHTSKIDLGVHDWRNRELKFNNATLGEIFSEVAVVYGIGFEFNTGLSGERYMVSFAPGEELQMVMSILRSTTGEFDFEITPDKVIINKPSK